MFLVKFIIYMGIGVFIKYIYVNKWNIIFKFYRLDLIGYGWFLRIVCYLLISLFLFVYIYCLL